MKRWYESRTIWFNLASAILIIGTEFAQLSDLIKPEYQELFKLTLLCMTVLGNTILRILTTKPLGK